MKFLSYWGKTLKENIREWKIFILALVFGPFFVYMMYAYFGAATPSYSLLVADRDSPIETGSGPIVQAGQDLVAAWAAARYPDGKPVFKITAVGAIDEARRRLKNRDADLLIIIPEGLSRALGDQAGGKAAVLPPLRNIGDESSVRFMVAAAFADSVSYATIGKALGKELPAFVEFEAAGAGRPRTDFDLYVPALLVLAIIMVLFTAAASLIKEVDKGTITRLVLSKLTTAEFLGAITVNQLFIGLAALGLTYLSAMSVGYRGAGSALLVLLVGAVSIVSVMAMSLLVAAWMKTIYELLTVGVFPFFVLMFFSESMFPLPRITLFSLAGRSLYANDILPTALTVKAFNKILNFDAGLRRDRLRARGHARPDRDLLRARGLGFPPPPSPAPLRGIMSKSAAGLPRVILHNSVSLDESLTGFEPDLGLHYRLAGRFGAEAHLIGWKTIKTGFETYGEGIPSEEPADFRAPGGRKKRPYWIVPDTRGRLKGMLHACRRSGLCRDVIVLVSDRTPGTYIEHLERRNYPWLRTGRDHADLKKALAVLSRTFGIATVLADTGRILGTRLLDLDLVSEISLLVHPVLVGKGAYPIFAGLQKKIVLLPRLTKAFQEGTFWLVFGVVK